MLYEKRLPAAETKSILPPRSYEINGRMEIDPGIVIHFIGKPPICDTMKYAKEKADWEERLRMIPFGDKEAKEKRTAEVDKYICDWIENYDEFRAGLIFPAKTNKQRLLEQNQPVCIYCGDEENPFVAGSPQALIEHQMKNHREEMLSAMAEAEPVVVKQAKPLSRNATDTERREYEQRTINS